MPHLYQIALVTHIVGLTTMAGSTLVAYILASRVLSLYEKQAPKAVVIHETASRLNILFGVGMLLLILSGVTMMALTRGVYGEQLWFRIKFGLIITVIINAVAIGRRQRMKLTAILSDSGWKDDNQQTLENVKRITRWFYLSQLLFFLAIYTLSVFKFN